MKTFDEIYAEFEKKELNKSQTYEENQQQMEDGDIKFIFRLFYNFLSKKR